jgi:hypothetical protein
VSWLLWWQIVILMILAMFIVVIAHSTMVDKNRGK